MKKGAEARKFAISLGSLEYSGDLASQLMKFSAKMEAVFKCLQDLRQKKVTDEEAYAKHFRIIDDKLVWYTKAEAPLLLGWVDNLVLRARMIPRCWAVKCWKQMCIQAFFLNASSSFWNCHRQYK